jgi:hypothetical protein
MDPFELVGVLHQEIGWLRAEHLSGPDDVLTTYRAVSTLRSIVVTDYFALADRTSVDSVFSDVGATRDPEKSQIFVELVSLQGGAPAVGATVATPGAQRVAYFSGTQWVADSSGTQQGAAALLNVNAAPYPGSPIALTVKVGDEEDVHQIAAEAGNVTLARIGIGFQEP